MKSNGNLQKCFDMYIYIYVKKNESNLWGHSKTRKNMNSCEIYKDEWKSNIINEKSKNMVSYEIAPNKLAVVVEN